MDDIRDDQLSFSVAGVPMPMSEQVAAAGRVLRRRWKIVVFVPLLALVVAVALSLEASKQYTATAKLYLYPTNAVSAALDPGSQVTPADPERDLNTEVSQITETPLADLVRRSLPSSESSTSLLTQVSAALEGTTNIVDVRATDQSPVRAARIANSFASDYLGYSLQSQRAQFSQALAALPPTQRASATAKDLQSAIATMTPDAAVTQTATVPTSPSSPKALTDAIIALIVGLVVAILAAIGVELFDRSVRDEDEAVAVSRLPSLGVIPRPPSLMSVPRGRAASALPRRRRVSAPGSTASDDRAPVLANQRLSGDLQTAESYGSLAVTIALQLGPAENVVMFTSPGPQDGKTSVCLGLAAALAELGQNVIAVECDMRRPRFAEYLGLPPEADGLSSVLTGNGDPTAALVDVEVATSANSVVQDTAGALVPAMRDGRKSGLGTRRFRVLPSGPAAPVPLRLLGGPALPSLLRHLQADADIVLLDTPPLGVLNDAAILASKVDQVVLVARLEHTRRDALRRCRTIADQFHSPVIGVVSVGGPRSGALAYYTARQRLGAARQQSSPARQQPSAESTERSVSSGNRLPAGTRVDIGESWLFDESDAPVGVIEVNGSRDARDSDTARDGPVVGASHAALQPATAHKAADDNGAATAPIDAADDLQASEPGVQASEPGVQASEPEVQASEPEVQASEPAMAAVASEAGPEGSPAPRSARKPDAKGSAKRSAPKTRARARDRPNDKAG